MKVIFLDHDDVICLDGQFGSRFKKIKRFFKKNPEIEFEDRPISVSFDDFDKKAIKVLNEILEETGAEIVVSSDWRLKTSLENMQEYYKEQGIAKSPIDYTDEIPNMNASMWDYPNYEILREVEIRKWLDEHPEVTHWVAIDDLDMSEKIGEISGNIGSGLKNFVLTPKSSEGIKQCGIKEKVLSFLL